MTSRGLFNQMLLVFIFLLIFGQIVEQAMPMFVFQRTLYEARERPAKAYSWVAFLFGTIIVELCWNSVWDNSLLPKLWTSANIVKKAHGRVFLLVLVLPPRP